MIYNIGLCEAEAVLRRDLTGMVKRTALKNQLQVKVKIFDSLKSLENYLSEPSYEPLHLIIINVDIEGKKRGLNFIKKLRSKKNKIHVIFIADSDEHVLEGYTVEPKGFIIEPVDENVLEDSLMRALNNLHVHQIVLDCPNKSITVDLDSVTYLEITDNESIIHYANSNKTDRIRLPSRQIKNLLPKNQFFQTHRSYIVSLPAIHAINKKEITLENNEHIPINWQYYRRLQEKLLYWFIRH